MLLAEAFLTYCPADLCGRECPMTDGDCFGHADDQGRLVDCWAVVQHLLGGAAQGRTDPVDRYSAR